MLVELGGGTNPHPKADVVIDLRHPRNAPAQDATVTPWQCNHGPWEEGGQGYLHSGLIDAVYASHFMEHIPKGKPIIDVMNEAWRILKPGGTFTMVMPLVGYTSVEWGGVSVNGWQPYADPTHVQYWWLPESLLYFCEGPFKPHADYGIHTWAALGPWIEPEDATVELDYYRFAFPGLLAHRSFWSVRSGWEGIARLVKP